MGLAFVIDNILIRDGSAVFRLGLGDVENNPNYVDLPWGDVRLVSEFYNENGGSDVTFPYHGSTLRTELLQGEMCNRVVPTFRRTVARHIADDAVDYFHDAMLALVRRQPYWFKHNALRPSWIGLHLDKDGVCRHVAVVGENIRVGHNDVNALVWRTGETEWKLEFITPNN